MPSAWDTRLVALMLFINMTVAFWTAEKDAFLGVLSNPDKFQGADAYNYWFAALLIMILGPGLFALDTLARSPFLPACQDSELCGIIDEINFQTKLVSNKNSFKKDKRHSGKGEYESGRAPCALSTCSRRSAWAGQKSRRWLSQSGWPAAATRFALLVLMPRLDEEWPTAFETPSSICAESPGSAFSGFIARRAGFCASSSRIWCTATAFTPTFLARLLRFFGTAFVVLSTVHNVYEGGWRRMLAYRLTDLTQPAVRSP